jgi:hypothetical protein
MNNRHLQVRAAVTGVGPARFGLILEVDEERALQVASQVVAYTRYPMEVRRVMDHSAQP